VRGRADEDHPPAFSMELRYITPGYFQALAIPVVKGRGFTDRDTRDAPPVIVMNETLAQRYFGSADPIGAQTTRGTIVGVVADVRQIDLDRPAVPELFYPMAQNWSQLADLGMSLVVRTRERPEAIIEPVRALVRDVNPNLAIFNIRRMDQVLSDSLWDVNLYLWLIGLFAGVALLLAAIGLYGVISYSVAIRGREWAVRLALGSDPAALARLVVRRGLYLCSIGIMIGVLGTLAFGLALPNLPIALNPNPATFARVTAMLLGIALLASLIPAFRITRIAPAAALRVE
jgi:putative ABC transport system permease protein